MIEIVIIGTGGLGREVAFFALECEKYTNIKIIGFLDDDPQKQGKIINNLPVLGNINWLKNNSDIYNLKYVCAIADPIIRKKIIEKIEKIGVEPHTLISPDVKIEHGTKIGLGSIICPGAQISVNVEIKDFVIVNRLSYIAHDVILENYVTINPLVSVSGNNIIKEGVYIGTGAILIQGLIINEWSIIGSGSIITHNIDKFNLIYGKHAEVKKIFSNFQERSKFNLTKK
ncbi:MAG: NeuD/PglB/VioB family sugar acetyltransferase [Promethearchaeia archaeon]